MRRRFVTLDVFTARRFAGNPLAVVLDVDGLDRDTMQAVAREFNYPETVFTFAPGHSTHRARVRIFTPAHELPFAGHPTVGTAVLLGLRDGATRFAHDPALGAALDRIALHAESRRCLILLGEMISMPGLIDRLAHTLVPEEQK